MSLIHVNRDRQNLGQFPPEEIAQGLQSGRFLPTDLAWREGMEAWQPLSNFSDLPFPSDSATSAPVPVSENPSPVAPANVSLVPAWETLESVGMPQAWAATVRQVVTDPVTTFRHMTKTGGFPKPFLYCYLTSFVSALVGIFGSLAWLAILPHDLFPLIYQKLSLATLLGQLAISIPIMLVVGVLVPFAFSSIYFLMVKLLTKKTAPYETVFRAYCYTAGTLALLNLLPIPPIQVVQVIYVFFALVIATVYLVIAMREVVGLTLLEAIGVVVLPMVLFCFCCIALVGGSMALVGSSALQNLGH